jgi:hypothetical protein
MRLLIITLFFFFANCPVFAQNQEGCKSVTLLKPTPFLGTANEIIILSDGSIWEDMSYKYLYLYAYNPRVIICPAQGRMYLERGGSGDLISFSVTRIK